MLVKLLSLDWGWGQRMETFASMSPAGGRGPHSFTVISASSGPHRSRPSLWVSLKGLSSPLCDFLGRLRNIHFLSCCCLVAKSCLTLCDPMNYSTPGFLVLHSLPEFAQTHVHQVSDAIHLSHPLSSPSLLALNLSQHQGLFQWVGSSHQVVTVLELQLQHQSFQ